MKILETVFLILTILIPILLFIIMIFKIDRVKKNKKYRTRMICLILLTLILNGSIYGVVKYINQKDYNEKEITGDNKTDDINENDTPNKIESPKDDKNKTSKGFIIEIKNGVTYIDGYLVVNKTYPLPSDYVPTGTIKDVNSDNCQLCIIKEAYEAFNKMKSDASNLGLNLWIQSGYRSYNYQKGLYNSYVKRSGQDAADTYSARPGHSEHQSGYAFDLNSISDSFATTKEGIWVNENAYKYGFIIRYPKGKENETGYKYESWHLRYVGVDLASRLYNAGDWITLEDYFGITSEYLNN